MGESVCSPVDTIGLRRAGRRVFALLAIASVALAACGYDGPPRQSEDAPDPASTTFVETGRRDTSPVDTGPLDTGPVDADAAAPGPAPTSSVASRTSSAAPSGDSARLRVAPASRPTSTPPTSAPERVAPRRVLVIGDSSAAAMRWTAGAQGALRGASFTLDLESCRRLVSRSCNGREGYTPSTALDALREHAAGNHDTLIMATGYNDMDRNFADAFDRIVAEARGQGIDTILWTTYREEVGYQLPTGASSAYSEMNDQLALRVLSGDYPELRILDWWGYTQDTPSWLASDGVHFARAGAFGLADMISRELAALDGRPCPVSWELWTDPADPCPPPLEELERRGDVPPVLYLYDAIG